MSKAHLATLAAMALKLGESTENFWANYTKINFNFS